MFFLSTMLMNPAISKVKISITSCIELNIKVTFCVTSISAGLSKPCFRPYPQCISSLCISCPSQGYTWGGAFLSPVLKPLRPSRKRSPIHTTVTFRTQRGSGLIDRNRSRPPEQARLNVFLLVSGACANVCMCLRLEEMRLLGCDIALARKAPLIHLLLLCEVTREAVATATGPLPMGVYIQAKVSLRGVC